MHNEVTPSHPLPLRLHWSFLYGLIRPSSITLPSPPPAMWSLGTEKPRFTGVKVCLVGEGEISSHWPTHGNWLCMPWLTAYISSSRSLLPLSWPLLFSYSLLDSPFLSSPLLLPLHFSLLLSSPHLSSLCFSFIPFFSCFPLISFSFLESLFFSPVSFLLCQFLPLLSSPVFIPFSSSSLLSFFPLSSHVFSLLFLSFSPFLCSLLCQCFLFISLLSSSPLLLYFFLLCLSSVFTPLHFLPLLSSFILSCSSQWGLFHCLCPEVVCIFMHTSVCVSFPIALCLWRVCCLRMSTNPLVLNENIFAVRWHMFKWWECSGC